MFDTATLLVIAQQNSANASYPFPTTANFNTQSNQGGSVFSPDGSVLYTAFNIAPVNSTQANVSQLMLNDPDNLLIKLALQLPENLIGRMIDQLRWQHHLRPLQSGFMMLPVSTIYNNPIAVPQSSLVLLTNDQCGVTAATATAAGADDEPGHRPIHRDRAGGHLRSHRYPGTGRIHRTRRRRIWRRRISNHPARRRRHSHTSRHRRPNTERNHHNHHRIDAGLNHQADRHRH